MRLICSPSCVWINSWGRRVVYNPEIVCSPAWRHCIDGKRRSDHREFYHSTQQYWKEYAKISKELSMRALMIQAQWLASSSRMLFESIYRKVDTMHAIMYDCRGHTKYMLRMWGGWMFKCPWVRIQDGGRVSPDEARKLIQQSLRNGMPPTLIEGGAERTNEYRGT